MREAIEDFMQKKTHFHADVAPLTDADLPTLTICLENKNDIRFGIDFNISLLNSDLDPWITLSIGEQNISDMTGSQWFLLELKHMVVYQDKDWVQRDCFKMNVMRAPLEILDLVGGILFIQIVYSNEMSIPEDAILYITSEENAYGAVFLKWYDGQVQHYTLRKGKMHYIKIYELREYKYIATSCKDESYYQCLASKLEGFDDFNNITCSGFTLPGKTKYEYFPECSEQGNLTMTESQQILYYHHTDSDVCKGKMEKSCIVREFYLEDWGKPYPFDDDETTFTFQCFYGLPESSNGHRIGKPSKRVYQEYFQMDVFGLIGTIGGTLGLTIGFSLVTCISWASESTLHLLSTLKSSLSRK